MAITDRVKNWLYKDIQEGIFTPGSQLPTRMTLMKKYKIARASIDKVIRQLVEEGVLYSVQGSGTYVKDIRDKQPHLYVILNTEVECEEANVFHLKLSSMLASASRKIDYTIVGSKEFEKTFTEVLQNSSARVIWSRPSIKSYGYIANLNKAAIPQILINRPIKAYNFVTTDTEKALDEVFKLINSKNTKARMGLLAPTLDLEESFLSEREIYFHEKVFEYGFSLEFMGRVKDKSSKQIFPAIRQALLQIDKIDYLFVPDFYIVPFVISIADERGIKLGKDLQIITIDWNEDMKEKGIICVKQRWDEMFKIALDWAQNPTLLKIQEFITPQILVT